MDRVRLICLIIYFNSQPHKEADVFTNEKNIHSESISTHSLTRRLTSTRAGIDYTLSISTHSLTRRLTVYQIHRRNQEVNFNSQPHKEADISNTMLAIY